MNAPVQKRMVALVIGFALARASIAAGEPAYALGQETPTDPAARERAKTLQIVRTGASQNGGPARPVTTSPRAGRPAPVDDIPAPAGRAPTFPAAVIQVYRASCLQCHDADGTGEAGRIALPRIPDFTEPRWQAAHTDEHLTHSILEGKGKSMPPMKGKLGSADVKQMVAFVRGFRGGSQVIDADPDPPAEPVQPVAPIVEAKEVLSSVAPAPRPSSSNAPDSREARQVFQRFCLACHGPDGRGSTLRARQPAIPDFTAAVWHERRSDTQMTVSVLEGKGTEMPSFRGKVSPEQVRSLVAFIRSFGPSRPQAPAAASDDFEVQFRKLTEELESLRQQVRAGSQTAAKPSYNADRPARANPPLRAEP
jgi:mono/diheme cytochrome c family protein